MAEVEPGSKDTTAFFGEVAAAFRRLRPQGTAGWNFSDAFTRLEKLSASPSPSLAPPVPEVPPRGALRQAADRHLLARIEPWVAARAAAAADEVTRRILAEESARVEEGIDATVEAFRFLAARVEVLEGAGERRREPIDGTAWLADPPDVEDWHRPVADWMVDQVGGRAGDQADEARTGPVLVGECGSGGLANALVEAGVTVLGAEPRGTVAWEAARAGLEVYVGSVAERLASLPASGLGGLVLVGVVDRSPVEELIELLATATDRLAPGAPFVVISTRPDAVAEGWRAVARDLLPGRPLHPETWELLLQRAGYTLISRMAAVPAGGGRTYAVGGIREQ